MEKSGKIINKIGSTITRYGMLSPGKRVVVAVSGGPDSVCLLDVLNKLSRDLKINLIAAHYDHGLRQNEDPHETQLVKDISTAMDIPFETEKATNIRKETPSLEEQAREARYAFLERIRNKHGAQKIATGHNLNDQAETILMRLLRGSGPSGLAGIPPVRDNIIIRPLIEITRNEIIDYLKERGLLFSIDSSNTNKKHLRNKIRLELMPCLLEYQPRLLERLGTFSNILREEDAFLESMALTWIEKELMKTEVKSQRQHQEIGLHAESSVNHESDFSQAPETASWIQACAGMTTPGNHRGYEQITKEDISFDLSSLKKLPGALKNRVVRNLLKKIDGNIYPPGYDHVESVLKILDNEKPQCSVDLPNGITVKKTYDRLDFGKKQGIQDTEYSYNIENLGLYCLGATGKTLLIEDTDCSPALLKTDDPLIVYLDAGKIRFPMTARNFRPGDRFIPLGMKGHKKVKNFFIDLKVPAEKRTSTPILTSGDKIAWVCGYRIDERFKVTQGTKKIIRMTIQPIAAGKRGG